MYFEQRLKNDINYYHQDKNGWKAWCDAHYSQIIADFIHDLPTMTRKNQRYFGDWISYSCHGDVGYYLGARFVQWICKTHAFDDILSYDLPQIKHLFCQFTGEHHD